MYSVPVQRAAVFDQLMFGFWASSAVGEMRAAPVCLKLVRRFYVPQCALAPVCDQHRCTSPLMRNKLVAGSVQALFLVFDSRSYLHAGSLGAVSFGCLSFPQFRINCGRDARSLVRLLLLTRNFEQQRAQPLL